MKHVFWIPGECLVFPCQSVSSLQEVSQLSQLQLSEELNTPLYFIVVAKMEERDIISTSFVLLCIYVQYECDKNCPKTQW